MELYPDFFNDVFGPIMQPGSSSHTAGPCRLGYLAHSLLGEKPARVQFIMDPESSFAGTFGIMNENLGMLAGILGMLPDDERLFKAETVAAAEGIEYDFVFESMKESDHINALKIVLSGINGKTATLVGDSTGGGMVETKYINGFPYTAKGDSHEVLIFDRNRTLTGKDINGIRSFLKAAMDEGSVEAEEKGVLYYFKLPEFVDITSIKKKFPQLRIGVLKAILPVVTTPKKKGQLFNSVTGWRQTAKQEGISMFEAAIRYEADSSGWSSAEIIGYMKMIERKMYRQTHAVYEESFINEPKPFSRQGKALWENYTGRRESLSGSTIGNAIKWSWGVRASLPGVESVPGPMGSGGGYIYSALYAVKEERGFSDEDLLRGLFIAAGIGAVAYTRTHPTGEVIGCTGECGVCGSMAAAALAEMAGGTPEQVENAASLSLQATIGIPCDPIPGGLGQPCFSRSITAVCMSIVFADLALSGIEAVLPYHEVLDVADEVGRRLPASLLCTSQGGCCSAPSAKKQTEKFNQWFKENASSRAGNRAKESG